MAPKRDKSKEKLNPNQRNTRATITSGGDGAASSSNNVPTEGNMNDHQEQEGHSEKDINGQNNDQNHDQNNDQSEQVAPTVALNESLQRYIANIVNATIGLNRAEDLRTRRAEYEEERARIREDVVNTIRDTLRAPTPPGVNDSLHNMNRPPEHSTAHPSMGHVDNVEPQHLNQNVQNFLNQVNALDLNAPSPNISRNVSHTSSSRAFEFHKWGLKFDNVRMTVDDFIFRLTKLKASYNASCEDIFLHFHLFVTGTVESWFWTFLKTNPNANWENLKFALIEQYRGIETDSELSRKMFDRRQGQHESFDSFYNDILVMNARLHTPKSRKELIDLIKQNVKRRTGELLITFSTQSLAEMVYVCRSIEKHSQNEAFKLKSIPQNSSKKQICEMDNDFSEDESIGVNALNVSPNKQNQLNYTCWNCKVKGHSFLNRQVSKHQDLSLSFKSFLLNL